MAASPTIEGERILVHSGGTSSRTIELSVTPQRALQAQFLGDSAAVRATIRNNEFVLRDQAGREIAHLGGPLARNAAP